MAADAANSLGLAAEPVLEGGEGRKSVLRVGVESGRHSGGAGSSVSAAGRIQAPGGVQVFKGGTVESAGE